MRASAPGKLILIGEHAVVHGQPALVTAVDRRLTVHLTPGSTAGSTRGQVELDLPSLDTRTRATWKELSRYARQVHERWERYAQAPSPRLFARLRGQDPAHLVKVALGEAVSFLHSAPHSDPEWSNLPALRLTVESELPIGSGFGSSAALAVAVLAGALAFHGADAELAEIERLALEVERRQHGLPSGVDSATVLHGGGVWAERDDPGRLVTEPLDLDVTALARFRVFDTGTPRQTTGEVVAAVRERLDRDPRLGGTIEEIGDLTRRLRRVLEADGGRGATESAALPELLEIVREAELRLEALGVVPEPVRELIRHIEAEGGAAKISGAGALSSPPGGLGAGSLLVLHPEPERIPGWSFLTGLEPLELRLGAAGLRLEPD